MTYWKSKEFKELQEHWYRQLEATGFQDKEKLVGGEVVLKNGAAHAYRCKDLLTLEAKECYFLILSAQVQEAEFRSEVDRLVLTWYADGRKIKDICQELQRMGKSLGRDSIRFMIRRYEMKWGMRIYSRQELHLK